MVLLDEVDEASVATILGVEWFPLVMKLPHIRIAAYTKSETVIRGRRTQVYYGILDLSKLATVGAGTPERLRYLNCEVEEKELEQSDSIHEVRWPSDWTVKVRKRRIQDICPRFFSMLSTQDFVIVGISWMTFMPTPFSSNSSRFARQTVTLDVSVRSPSRKPARHSRCRVLTANFSTTLGLPTDEPTPQSPLGKTPEGSIYARVFRIIALSERKDRET